MKHFGVTVLEGKYGFYLQEKNYAIISRKNSVGIIEDLMRQNAYTDISGKEYTKEWCLEYWEKCMQNFYLNMEYFKGLSKEKFDKEIAEFLEKNPSFKRINDLNRYAGVPVKKSRHEKYYF